MDIIRKDDEIIGYVADVRAEVLGYDDVEGIELITALKDYKEDDLVRCWYHPMGSWYIARLEEV